MVRSLIERTLENSIRQKRKQLQSTLFALTTWICLKTGKRKVQGVQQSQTAARPRHQEEEETDKTKQAQIEQTYEKHHD